LHGFAQPTFGVSFGIGLQYFGDHRRQRPDILLVKRINIRLVRVWQRIGSLNLSQRQIACLERFEAADAFRSRGEEQDRLLRIFDGLGEGEQQPFFEQFSQGYLPAGIFSGGQMIEQDVEFDHV